jgi:hypothetical protein
MKHAKTTRWTVLPSANESRMVFTAIPSFVERVAEDPRADGSEGDDPTAMLFGKP